MSRIKVNIPLRFAIAGLLWAFMFFGMWFVRALSILNVLPHIFVIPNWLFYPVVFAFVIAYIDVLVMLLLFFIVLIVGFWAVIYGISLTGLFSWSAFWSWQQTTNAEIIISVIAYTLIIFFIFNLWEYIHIPHRNREQTYYYQTEAQAEDGTHEEAKPEHTKEELARLLNFWQMKFAQAKTEEERSMANEKIREYQKEYERLKAEAQEGTTPERAKLIERNGEKNGN